MGTSFLSESIDRSTTHSLIKTSATQLNKAPRAAGNRRKPTPSPRLYYEDLDPEPLSDFAHFRRVDIKN
jgi:hypothetical protein